LSFNLYYYLRYYCRRPQSFLVHGSVDPSHARAWKQAGTLPRRPILPRISPLADLMPAMTAYLGQPLPYPTWPCTLPLPPHRGSRASHNNQSRPCPPISASPCRTLACSCPSHHNHAAPFPSSPRPRDSAPPLPQRHTCAAAPQSVIPPTPRFWVEAKSTDEKGRWKGAVATRTTQASSRKVPGSPPPIR
jgi:hypothetical protein